MKKCLIEFCSIVLCLAMILSLGACGKKETSSTTSASAEFLDFGDEHGEGLTDGDTASSNSSSSGDTASGADSDDGGKDTGKIDISSKDPFANVPKKLKNTTVVFACWGDEGHEKYKEIYDKFTRKSGIKVKLMMIEENNIIADVAQRVAAGNPPDLMVNNNNPVSVYGILSPIQKYIDLSDDFWDDGTTEIMTVGSNTYGVNSWEGMWMPANFLIYNKNLFTQNSITSPGDYWKRGKWTYENMLKCMTELAKTGNYGGYIESQVLATSFGSPIISYDPKTLTYKNNVTNSKVMEAFDYISNLYKQKIWESGQWFGLFGNGQIGIMDGGLWGTRFNGKFSSADGSMMAAVPFPTSYKGQETYQVFGLRSYGIVKGAKNPEGAAYFLRYFLDYDYYKEAGFSSFKNKDMESFYFDEFVPAIKNGKLKIMYDYTPQPQRILYPGGDTKDVVEKAEIASGQYATVLASKKNELDTAVSQLNSDIQKYK